MIPKSLPFLFGRTLSIIVGHDGARCISMEERTMKLYGFPPSPNTWKVRALAAHLNLPLGLEIVDLTKPRTPEYLAINPTGRTPTLVDGDYTLWESNAI